MKKHYNLDKMTGKKNPFANRLKKQKTIQIVIKPEQKKIDHER